MRENLGKMLLEANLIDEVQMQIALSEQARTGKKFGSTLVDLKFIDENVLAAFLSKQIDVPCISLLHIDIPRKVLRKVPGRLARECRAIPIRMEEKKLEVAMIDPTDGQTIDVLETATGMEISPLIAPQSSLEKMIERFYPLDPNEDDTLAARNASAATVSDPIFMDLIEELESGDYGERLQRIEERLEHIWVLLEKVLRQLETPAPIAKKRV
ncbi:MAG TPA: hypothetical protein VIL97_10725 [Thermoanaerobaculia bacterium]